MTIPRKMVRIISTIKTKPKFRIILDEPRLDNELNINDCLGNIKDIHLSNVFWVATLAFLNKSRQELLDILCGY